MLRGYVVRLYPNKTQERLIIKTFGATRFVYNAMLQDRKETYEQTGEYSKKSWKVFKQEWMTEVDSTALASEWTNLNSAFNNFVIARKSGRHVGYPKFKSKKNDRQSYKSMCVSNNIRFEDIHHIKLPKLGVVRFSHGKKLPEGIIKNATISRTPSGKYFASILLNDDFEIPVDRACDTANAIGLDYSSTFLYVDSQGNQAEYPRFYRKAERKLKSLHKQFSRKVKGSKNREKAKVKLARAYEKVSNCRRDFLHKLSNRITDDYDIICVEDLDMQNMSRTLHLGKSTFDNGFGEFRCMLKYKSEMKGKIYHIIDKWYPSSKTCHNCGYINKSLTLNDRVYNCPKCGQSIDRDYNAALNIRDHGISELLSQTAGTAGLARLITHL